MKISPYMDINRIEFMVTYQCSGHCKHCSVGDKLSYSDGAKHISSHLAAEVIDKLTKLFTITSVMTFGGEPLLYADTVCVIHEMANRCGVNLKQIITNGFFTKDDERRKKTAWSLKEAGVSNLLLSVDAFHQETISVEDVYSFARHAHDAEIPNIKLHPAWVVDEEHDNPFNKKTKEVINVFSDLGIPVSSGNNIIMAGNAVEYLAQFYDKPKLNLSDSCGSMPYTEPLTNITSLSIVPNGDVMVCGFVIGNIHKQDIQNIVSQYDPYKNEWMNAIITGGASALLDLSKQQGVFIDYSQCYSVCDICHKINNLC